ncbi:MAG: hypothetical protein HC902_09005 [Calothrix sp. SM1_5_4]|nr:hypothetical protein [Calothrix sp. SM1_5_4]
MNSLPTALLPGFSDEQYAGRFAGAGHATEYYDHVRSQMAGGDLKFNPVEELRSMMTEICANIHDREIAVDLALKAGMQNKSHPPRLPDNIYGTSGEWETYSTPSRDARLKVAFVELRAETARFINLYRSRDPKIVYEPALSRYSANCGDNDTCYLIASLAAEYEDLAASPSCRFSYVDSAGRTNRLDYTDIVERLFRLSFDPYHCVELRWGATGQEAATCPDDQSKLDWYEAQQGLRNQTERTYDARMDFDVRGTARAWVWPLRRMWISGLS